MPSAVRLLPAVALMALLVACQDPTPEPVTPPTPTQSPTRATPVPVSEGIAEEYQALAETLTEIMGVAPDAIGPAAAEGMLQVRWGTNFAYLPEGGSHVVFGDMIDLRTGEQITEASRKAMRLAALARVEDSIEFLPKSPRHVATVFTDIARGRAPSRSARPRPCGAAVTAKRRSPRPSKARR